MAKVLIVGCGDLGTAIAANLQHEHQVIGLRRSIHEASGGMQMISANVSMPKTLFSLKKLQPNILVYCVAAAGQTDTQYLATYVTGLKNVLETQANNHALSHIFFVSSTRVYGQNNAEIIDEDSPTMPVDFGGKRLLEAEGMLKNMPCNATSMRLSGIYGKGRLYLANIAKDITQWPTENHWSNRIHRDDAAGFIAFLVEQVVKNQAVEDCYIVTDDMPTLQYEVLTWLANQQKIDISNIKVPATQGGKRLSNQRLRNTGFQLQYPNYQAGYGHILQDL